MTESQKELPALVALDDESVGYFLEMPQIKHPVIKAVPEKPSAFLFHDSFDYGAKGHPCGGYGIGGDCPTAAAIFDYMIDSNFSNCVEYWGEVYSLNEARTLHHEVYYDLTKGFAGGQVNNVSGFPTRELEGLLIVLAERLLESVGVIRTYEKVVTLPSQRLLVRLERGGLVCPNCESRFESFAAYYDHKCEELGRISSMLYDVATAATNKEKKDTLELLMKRVISNTSGFEVIGRDVRHSDYEIDLKVANEGTHPLLRIIGTPILVECRNTADPVDAKSIRDFGGKLKSEGAKTGLLVTRKGVTGKERTDAREAIKTLRLGEAVSVLVFDDTDLVLLANGKKLVDLLRMEFYGKRRVLPQGMGLPKKRDELPSKFFR